MKDLIAKLTVGLQDADTKKVLESIGITKSNLDKVTVIEKPETLDEALDNFEFRSEFDRRITKAVNTNETKLKEKFDFVEKEQEKKDDGKDKASTSKLDDNDPVQKLLKQMAEKIEALEKDKKTQSEQSKKTQALEKLKSKNIPDVYANLFDLDKDFDEQLVEIEKKFQADTAEIIKRSNPNIKLPNPDTGGKNTVSKENAERFKKMF